MKWKMKDKIVITEWSDVFAWRPVVTENGYRVWLETVQTRYKVHMSGGEYVYKLKD